MGLRGGCFMEQDIAMGLRSGNITLLATRMVAAATDARMDGSVATKNEKRRV